MRQQIGRVIVCRSPIQHRNKVPLLFRDFDGPCGTIDRADTSARPVDRQHPVAKVGRLAALGDAGRLQAAVAVVVEQAGADAEQDRSEVDAHLVDEASAQQLAANARAEQVDVLAAGKPDGDLGGLAWAADEGLDAASGHVVGSGVRDDDRRGPPVEAGPVGAPPDDRGVIE